LKFHEAFEDDDYLYIITEYLDGKNIMEHIESRNVLSEQDVKGFMKQILSGLQYLHSKSIIHRDIKPENIMVISNDGHDIIKIIDFGIALSAKDRATQNVAGTMLYMAPEVFTKNVSFASDIWSCGIMTYIMLTGLYPYDETRDIVEQIRNGRVVFSQAFRDNYRQAYEFISKMLKIEPNSRSSANGLLKDDWLSKSNLHENPAEDRNRMERMKQFAVFLIHKIIINIEG